MKIKKLMYVLMGTILVFSSCSDNELENGGKGNTGDTKSSLVSLYSDEDCSEQSLLVENLLVEEGSANIDVNVPIHTQQVYMKYSSASGKQIKALSLNAAPMSRATAEFDMATTRKASVSITLPEDAVQPTKEEDAGFRFYHNTGVAMFEDDWPKSDKGYDNDFNDVVFEYDLKVTECQKDDLLPAHGYKEGLLLTLDVRAKGGRFPTKLGVELIGLDKTYINEIASRIVLKAGQGMMDELKAGTDLVVVEKELGGVKYTLTVDATTGNPVITLDGLTELSNPNDNEKFFQVNKEFIEIGRPMLRAEIKLTGKNRSELSAEESKAQLEAFRNLILDTKNQNFFIVAKNGTDREIHMKGYYPTRLYTGYDTDSKGGAEMMHGVPYCGKDGFVWGVKVPVGVKHTYESESFMGAYEGFAGWLNSNGKENTDWYQKPTAEKVVEAW